MSKKWDPSEPVTWELPISVKLAIADAVILFSKIDGKIIEIRFSLENANRNRKTQIARAMSSENVRSLKAKIKEVEKIAGRKFDAIEKSFDFLSRERHLIAHGIWFMIGDLPNVLSHAFLENNREVVSESFDGDRFKGFMATGEELLRLVVRLHELIDPSEEPDPNAH